jgi:spore maturation protein CgeB
VTRELFAHGVEAILGLDVLRRHTTRARRHAELCLLYEWTRRQRRLMAERFEPYGIEVRGDPGWAGTGCATAGYLDYFGELAAFYARTAINLNITSLQMRSAVNQRVFDCPATGGFLITDAQSDIAELFDEDEVVLYEALEELEEKVRFFVAHPAERRSISKRARRRVLAHHTHKERLGSLAGYLRRYYRG